MLVSDVQQSVLVILIYVYMASLVAQLVKSLPAMWETWVGSLGRQDPGRRKWPPTPVFLPAKSHGWRSLAGYSPWGWKQQDTSERLHLTSLFPFVLHLKDKVKMITGKHWLRCRKRLKISVKFGDSKQ